MAITEHTPIPQHQFGLETNYLDYISTEPTDQMVAIKGPTKQITVSLEYDTGREVLMQDTIVNNPETARSAARIRNETTQLYLAAQQLALLAAQRYNVDYRWIFNPTDPEGKMRQWELAHLDTGEPDELRTFVPNDELESEIKRVAGVAKSLGVINFNIERIFDPRAYEQTLREQVDKIRGAQISNQERPLEDNIT
jgi:hypothetical protein